MQDFTVPTLSLSRAKKQYNTSVPTRDQGLQQSSHSYQVNHPPQQQIKYAHYEHYITQDQPEQVRRTHIFPPRPPSAVQEQPPRDINKNVYLHSPEAPNYTSNIAHQTYTLSQTQPFEQIQSQQTLARSSSGRGLLTNPSSSTLVRDEMNDRQTSKRLDMNKMLFDRKIAKLLSQASIYDEQLQGACKDELSQHLEELIELKDSSLLSHRLLIDGLSTLIN